MAIRTGVILLCQRLLVSTKMSGSAAGHQTAISRWHFCAQWSLNYFWFFLSLGLLFICLSVLVLYLLHSSRAGRRRLNPIHYHLGKESRTLQPPLSPPRAFSMNPFCLRTRAHCLDWLLTCTFFRILYVKIIFYREVFTPREEAEEEGENFYYNTSIF